MFPDKPDSIAPMISHVDDLKIQLTHIPCRHDAGFWGLHKCSTRLSPNIAASGLLLLRRLTLKARSNQTPITASSTVSLVEALSKTYGASHVHHVKIFLFTVHVKLAEAAVIVNGPIRMDVESRV